MPLILDHCCKPFEWHEDKTSTGQAGRSDLSVAPAMLNFLGDKDLAIGLEQSGVAQAKWAIEWEKDAAKAFKVSIF